MLLDPISTTILVGIATVLGLALLGACAIAVFKFFVNGPTLDDLEREEDHKDLKPKP